MSEATGKPTTTGGDPNTTTSSNKPITRGSGDRSTSSGKQVEKDTKINLVDQGKPAEVNITLVAENPEDKKELPKKKTPTKKAKEKAEVDQVKDIQSLLEGVFMVVSLKAGDHWVLQPEESSQIATPLSKILDRYDLLSKASEVSDPVALVVATATIIVPRLMISQMTVTEKKKDTLVKNGVIGNEVKKGSPSSDGGSNGGTAKTTSKSNDGQFIKSIATEIQTGF